MSCQKSTKNWKHYNLIEYVPITLLNNCILYCCLQTLQSEQEDEIAKLEKEVEEKQFQHENRIRMLKTQFLREQRAFEKEAETRVQAMAERADKVKKPFSLGLNKYLVLYVF